MRQQCLPTMPISLYNTGGRHITPRQPAGHGDLGQILFHSHFPTLKPPKNTLQDLLIDAALWHHQLLQPFTNGKSVNARSGTVTVCQAPIHKGSMVLHDPFLRSEQPSNISVRFGTRQQQSFDMALLDLLRLLDDDA